MTSVLTRSGNWIFSGASGARYQAANASVQAAAATRRDVLVSLTSEVARNYFELRGAQNELAVLRRNADNERETLKITQARLDAGSGTDLDVARARAELNNTLAAIPPAESAAAHAIHRLGVLTGQQPTALTAELIEPAPMPQLPRTVAIGNPAELASPPPGYSRSGAESGGLDRANRRGRGRSFSAGDLQRQHWFAGHVLCRT